ncbi:MAG: hypothetical protein ACRDH2_10230, partial [Anaerolineales bacterium]
YKELEAVQRRQATLDELEVERERVTEARQQVGELMGQLKGQNEAAKAEGDVLKRRLETLQAATEPHCPTCGQPLDEPERAALVSRLGVEVEARRSQYRENQAQIRSLADQQTAFEKWLSQNSAELRARPGLLKKVA